MGFLTNRWKDFIFPLFLFFGTFFIYFHNLSPSVYGGDVGDFLSAIAVRGVPHPSGFPLFTVLGIIFSLLPINQTLAFKVGLISVLSSSFSVVLFYFISHELIKNKLISFISALILASFYIFWLYAEIAEVFALTNFFILLLILMAISYYKQGKMIFLYLLSFFAGLSLSNHEIILAIFPSLAILVLAKNGKNFFKPKVLIKCILLFLAGLIPYLYIPIAASHNPPVNWDNAVTFKNFMHLVLRSDYGWGVSPKFDLFIRFLAIKTYFFDVITEVTPASFVAILLGMFFLIKRKQFAIFSSIFIGFLFLGPVYVVYGFIPVLSGFILGVLERFYMLSALVLLIFLPPGVQFATVIVIKLFKKIKIPPVRIKTYVTIFSLLFLVIPLSLFRYNFQKTDLHNVWIGDELAKDLLSPLPQNSVLLVQGDTVFFNTEYIQYAVGFRKDVTVINLGTLSANSLVQTARETFKKDKNVYPEDVLYIKSIISVAKNRPIFSTHNLEYKNKKYGEIPWKPFGILYKLNENGKIAEADFLREQESVWKQLHLPSVKTDISSSKNSLTLSDISSVYAEGLTRLGNYLITNYNDFERAKIYYESAMAIAPDITGAYNGLGYYYLSKNDCQNAEKAFKHILNLKPDQRNAYVMLYGTYVICAKDGQAAKKVDDTFKQIFHTSISGEFKKELINVSQ